MNNESQGGQSISEGGKTIRDLQMVDLDNLASMTGFPKEFIKAELLLKDESEISIESLRGKVTDYLMKSELLTDS